MSAFTLLQCGGYGAEAIDRDEPNKKVSVGQKIKYGFEYIKNKISKNPKKSAAVGGGIGVGALLLLLLGITKPWKNKNKSEKGKGKENHSGDEGENKKATEIPVPITPDAEGGETVNTEEVTFPEPDDEAYEYLANKLFAPEETDYDAGNSQQQAAYGSDHTPDVSLGLAQEENSQTSSVSSNPVVGQGHENSGLTPPPSTTRSPSPVAEELKLNSELQIEVSQPVLEEVKKFCGKAQPYGAVQNRRNCDYVKLLVEFLAKIENTHHKPEDLTSFLEANATRCWQNSAGVAGSKRVIKSDVLDRFEELAKSCQFENGIINMKKTKGTNDWEIFKTVLLRKIKFAPSPSEPNKKILILR